ncbi:MAG: 23S rRNA (uracil(1939)-C(5))-methyltransferase RlmD [Lachnospiraceae bacterium]|nr:23S rRNA (uracil(1939)-C(5))-methyltransferase RlmD [Lachnospiraceae bacterium]
MYKKNDVIQLSISDLGSEGEGIGKLDGFPFFVKGALAGDVIEAGITKLKKTYGYARILRILTPSPDRVEPACPAFGRCGGCQLMHLSYEAQLRYKEKKVRDVLRRIGGLDEKLLEQAHRPILAADETMRYRNKAQYPFGSDRDGNTVFGFYATHSHRIVPCEDCLLGADESRPVLSAVRKWMEEYAIAPYDEEKGTGLLRHVLIRKSHTKGQLMVCLVINDTSLPREKELVSGLAGIPGMHSISYSVNMEQTNVIMGESSCTLWGEERITDGLRCSVQKGDEVSEDTIEYAISPLSFYQVNPLQTEKLYATALEYAGLTGNEVVWDLYCGIGTISLFMAKKAGKVYGVEIVPQAIEDARKNAVHNGIENAEFHCGAAEELAPELLLRARPDVVVVDPPRKGLDSACLETILSAAPQRIVYVSCDPATLARDLHRFTEGGYHLEKYRACDMFPQTSHVEVAALLERVSNRKADSYVKLSVKMEDYYRIKDAEGSETGR